jgi:MFS transporter, PAT family, beta-lactamase induction signal transducer AmpG
MSESTTQSKSESNTTSEKSDKKHPGWRDVLRGLRQRKVAAMLLLGMSAGLPFMLVGNTMGLWLREGGVELTAIGFLSWVGIMYSMKFLWAPIIDKTNVPVLGRLGHRRGWMLLAQVVVAAGLFAMAIVTPQGGLVAFGVLALVAAFGSATQDIVIDAWRIESAENGEELSLLSSAYQLGYRTALLLTDAWILVIAAKIGWVASYELIAGLMGLGMIAVMFARESRRPQAGPAIELPDPRGGKLGISDAMVVRWLLALIVGIAGVAYLVIAHNIWKKAWGWDDLVYAIGLPVALWLLLRRHRAQAPIAEATWSRPLVRPLLQFFDGAVGPLLMFFRDHGKIALLLLVAISLYRLPDFVLGPMANPFYNDIGIDKSLVGAVRGSIGWISTTVGIIAAGVFALRFGLVSTLMMGAILGPGSNLAFAYLAHAGADTGAMTGGLCSIDMQMVRDACQHPLFSLAMVIDNFCTGFAGVALVGYMSSLTSLGYTATQYALLSSFYAMPGKFLKGLSGLAVDSLSKTYGLIDAYAVFFVGTALLGIPVVLLCMWLVAHHRRVQREALPAVG